MNARPKILLTLRRELRYSGDMATFAPSLYDDWTERRARSNELSVSTAPLRVLDYLLDRYRNDPVAQKAARFPMPTEAIFDRRTMLVYRHVSFAPKSEVRNKADATTKVSRILQRIKAQAPQESIGAPAGGAMIGDDSQNPSMFQVVDALIRPSTFRYVHEKTFYADVNDYYRLKLLSEIPQERVNAAFALADVGALDDVNLLLDLLSLTPLIETSESDGSPPNMDNIEVDIPDITILEALLKRTITATKPYLIINERELLEACAMRLARKEFSTS